MINYDSRMLILDDNDHNRTLMKFAMQMANLTFDDAVTGQEALDLWQRGPGRYAFALLDIVLPDISGLEVARRIRQFDPGIAIIMCSTNDDPRTIEDASRLDADMFIVKPFQFDTLVNVARLLNRATLRANPQMMVIENTGRARWELRSPRNLLRHVPIDRVMGNLPPTAGDAATT
jgi:DNA-binding response OmpR family regulator